MMARIDNRRLRVTAIGVCLLSAAIVFCGCGKSQTAATSPKETAQNFLSALQAGSYEEAARAFDYITDARKQNENWDSIPAGQRKLIVRKLQEAKAGQLRRYSDMLGSDAKITELSNNMVRIGGSGGSITLSFTEREGRWYISQVW